MFSTPEDVETAFYRAFQDLDLQLMDRVWSSREDSTCIHPGGGLLQGKPSVMQSWHEVFSGTKRPTLVHRRLQETSEGRLAVHLVEELIRPNAEPGSNVSRVLATNIYRRGRDGWRMIAHHSSLPLAYKKDQTSSSGRLH